MGQSKNKVAEVAALFCTALLVTVLLVGSFLFSISQHVNPAWIMCTWLSVGFFAAIGWHYRRAFRSISFILFFSVWLVAHCLVFIFVFTYLGWLYYLPTAVVELFLFYMSANLLFGLRPPGPC